MPRRKWHGRGAAGARVSQQKSKPHPLGEFGWLPAKRLRNSADLRSVGTKEMRARGKENQGAGVGGGEQCHHFGRDTLLKPKMSLI